MLGLPGETQEDIDELIQFSLEISKIHPIALGIAPFVPKRNTPMDTASFAGIKVVEKRLKYLEKGLRRSKGRAQVRSTSAKWAWVEYMLAQGGPEMGYAALKAVENGGRFAHWKKALLQSDPNKMSPWHILKKKVSI